MGRHDRRPEEATLAAIFDGITATAEGVDRLETCEDWRPYVVADIPEPVTVRPVPAERKTGLEPAKRTFDLVRQSTDRVRVVRVAV